MYKVLYWLFMPLALVGVLLAAVGVLSFSLLAQPSIYFLEKSE
jgi:hypothetical protein